MVGRDESFLLWFFKCPLALLVCWPWYVALQLCSFISFLNRPPHAHFHPLWAFLRYSPHGSRRTRFLEASRFSSPPDQYRCYPTWPPFVYFFSKDSTGKITRSPPLEKGYTLASFAHPPFLLLSFLPSILRSPLFTFCPPPFFTSPEALTLRSRRMAYFRCMEDNDDLSLISKLNLPPLEASLPLLWDLLFSLLSLYFEVLIFKVGARRREEAVPIFVALPPPRKLVDSEWSIPPTFFFSLLKVMICHQEADSNAIQFFAVDQKKRSDFFPAFSFPSSIFCHTSRADRASRRLRSRPFFFPPSVSTFSSSVSIAAAL